MKFNPNYFISFMLLLIIELFITQTTGFLRHTVGDFLATIGVYCFIKSFYNIAPFKLGIGVLLFSFMIEFLQAASFLKFIQLDNNTTANILLGNTFSYNDLIAYTIGVLCIIIINKKLTTFYN